ncbi:MAG: acid phosphatase, partial [Ktedonobacterales bacterium]|nr:acid phosphatase [Ktedonobacterales bacterium]
MAWLAGCGNATTVPNTVPGATMLPHFDHIVIVVEENHSYSDIIGANDAPFINGLAQQGALFTASHAVTHPSEPNYLALFGGSTYNLSSDACPESFSGPNLASELFGHSLSFTGYSESMPTTGFRGCADASGEYARKHNPWVNFSDVPAASNQPFSSFPSDYGQLPNVAFVVPNLQNDMHDGSVASGDAWLQSNLGNYLTWAQTNNSLLILTWDEDDGAPANQIPTIFVGAHVKVG